MFAVSAISTKMNHPRLATSVTYFHGDLDFAAESTVRIDFEFAGDGLRVTHADGSATYVACRRRRPAPPIVERGRRSAVQWTDDFRLSRFGASTI